MEMGKRNHMCSVGAALLLAVSSGAFAGTQSSFGNSLGLRPAPDEPLSVRIAREKAAWDRQQQANQVRREMDRLSSELRQNLHRSEIELARQTLAIAQQTYTRILAERRMLIASDGAYKRAQIEVSRLEQELASGTDNQRRPNRAKLTKLALPLLEARVSLRKREAATPDQAEELARARDAMVEAGAALRQLEADLSDAVRNDGAWRDARDRLMGIARSMNLSPRVPL